MVTRQEVYNIVYQILGFPRDLKTADKKAIGAINEVNDNTPTINDSGNSADEVWSSQKTLNEINKANTTEINDGVTNTENTWSSQKITDEIAANAGGGGGEYMVAVWAEENATLGINSFEWAFGNGASTPADGGLTVYVPSGYTCQVVALSLRIGSGTANVCLVYNGTTLGAACNVVVSSGQGATNDSFTPVDISNNDWIGFRTITSSGTSSPNVITAWLKYTPI